MARRQFQQSKPKVRGVADIVFLLDSSGSMAWCFDGLIRNISSFVQGVNSDQQRPVDWKVGMLSAGIGGFSLIDFTSDLEKFVNLMGEIEQDGGDEFTLPALDWAADFDWRTSAHKFIVLFTDEAIAGGTDPDFQTSRLTELIEKLTSLRIKLFLFAVDCPVLKEIEASLPKSSYSEIDPGCSFDALLTQIGTTVSVEASRSQSKSSGVHVSKDLYEVSRSGIPPIRRLS